MPLLCLHCHRELPPQARFCPFCGVAVATRCRSCEKQLQPSALFCSSCGKPQSKSSQGIIHNEPLTSGIDGGAIHGTRKHATVLFADICGSTELLVGNDPEDAIDTLEFGTNEMSHIVRVYDGIVAKRMGDGIMALFGVPVSKENHALRACFAGIDIQKRLTDKAITVRIGIASGELLAIQRKSEMGDETDALGEIVSLAARLEQTAEPSGIHISAKTARLVNAAVNVKSSPLVALKGFPEPVETFKLLGRRRVSVSTILHSSNSRTPIIGRKGELAQISEFIERIRSSQGGSLEVIGEPGIGKTRLVSEVVRKLDPEEWTIIGASGERGFVAAGDSILRTLIAELLDFDHVDRGARLTELLSHNLSKEFGCPGKDIEHLVWLFTGEFQKDSLSQEQTLTRRSRAMRAARAVFLAKASDKPLLILIDDADNTDVGGIQFLRSLTVAAKLSPLGVIIIGRKCRQWDLREIPSHQIMNLNSLNKKYAEQLCEILIESSTTSIEVCKSIVQASEGNPLFIIEMAQAIGKNQIFSIESLKVPDRVGAVIAARIDQLTPAAKSVVQVLAATGRAVDQRFLVEIVSLTPIDISTAIDELLEAGLIIEDLSIRESKYSLTSFLVGEVAYSQLIKSDRFEIHKRISQLLKAQRESDMAWVAYHLAAANNHPDAATAYFQAGMQAYSHSAYHDASALLRHAVIEGKTAYTENLKIEPTFLIEIIIALRHALVPLGEQVEIAALLEEGIEIANKYELDSQKRHVFELQVAQSLAIGDQSKTLKEGTKVLNLARKANDITTEASTCLQIAQAQASLGRYSESLEFALTAREVARKIQTGDPSTASIISTLGRTWAIWCLSELGNFDEAAPLVSEAQGDLASSDNFVRLLAHLGTGLFWFRASNFELAKETLEPALSMADNTQFAGWWPAIASPLGASFCEIGNTDIAIELLQEAVSRKQARHGAGNALRIVHLATALRSKGNLQSALNCAKSAVNLARRSGEAGHEAYALLELSHCADGEESHEYCKLALSIANDLGMRPLAERCCVRCNQDT